MRFEDVFNQANRIVEEMYFNPMTESRRILISKENQDLVRELKELASLTPWLKCHVMGVVGSHKKWFVIQSCRENLHPGRVIYVDFRAKKVLKEVA